MNRTVRRPNGCFSVTAIVATSDLLALGVYDALRGSGHEYPKGISVIGHSDMPLVDRVQPRAYNGSDQPLEMVDRQPICWNRRSKIPAARSATSPSARPGSKEFVCQTEAHVLEEE